VADPRSRFDTTAPTGLDVSGAEATGIDLTTLDPDELRALLAQGYLGSMWLTGQTASRDLRRGRYTPESMRHPGKMMPTIPRYAIRTYTAPGDARPWAIPGSVNAHE